MIQQDGRCFQALFDWDRKFDPPSGHIEECNCDFCHSQHNELVNYGHVDFKCCTEAIDEEIAKGEYCWKNPIGHGDIHMKDGKCFECAGVESK